MAETLRELVVALSLDSSNFSRNMRTINAQIKEAKLSMLGQEHKPWIKRYIIHGYEPVVI